MSLSAQLFGRDSFIHKATNILGLGIPSWLDKKFGPADTVGPRLSDLSVQTSTYGADIPRLYGVISVATNLTWLEGNKLKEKVHKKKSGGKGGGSSKPTKTWTYSASFMLSICEGPIEAIGRIWCADKLIYNPSSDDLSTVIASNQAARGMRFYYGTYNQRPDSRMEAALGVGNVPAYRGLAYIVFDDFQLADYGNTLQAADFKIEVFNTSDDLGVKIVLDKTIFQNEAGNFLYDVGSMPSGTTDSFIWDGINSIYRVDEFGNSRVVGSFPNDQFQYDPNPHASRQGLIQGPNESTTYMTPILNPANQGGMGEAPAYYKCSDGLTYKVNGQSYNGYLINTGDTWFRVDNDNFSNRVAWGRLIVVPGAPNDTIAPSGFITPSARKFGWCGHEDKIYCVGSDWYTGIITLWTFDFGFNIVASVPLDSEFSAYIYEKGSFCDGEWYYGFTGNTSSTWRELLGTNVVTGEGKVYRVPIIPDFGANTTGIIRVQNGLLYELSYCEDGAGNDYPNAARLVVYRLNTPVGNSVPLADIIEAECGFTAMIRATDINTNDITDQVRGYRISGGTIRAALEPLQNAYPFDVVQSGYVVKFLRRGKTSMVTIPYGDLGATTSEDSGDVFKESRQMDSQLPAKVTVSYLDAAREYSVSEQYFEKLNPNTINSTSKELAIVLTADEAAKIAETLTLLPWLEKNQVNFDLPPKYNYLEPADVLTVTAPWASYELRITRISFQDTGKLQVTAYPNAATIYQSNAVGTEPPPPDGTIPYLGPTEMVLLDIPVIDEALQNVPGFVGVVGSVSPSWPGATIIVSQDTGQTWVDVQAYSGPCTYGTALNWLAQSAGELIDRTVLTVNMFVGTLESLTLDQMLLGQNYVAYGVPGRWEIMRFQTATLVSDKTYHVSGFVRGEKGTEWATGLHDAADYFVFLLDDDNAFIGQPISNLELPQTFRAITSDASLESGRDYPFTYKGVNLECLSPVYPTSTRDGLGNLGFAVMRRSRLGSSWWANGMESPIGETVLAFECDIMAGSTVKRTLTSSTGNFVYSVADQTTDFGSAQSTVDIMVYQLSTVVGRGYPLRAFV